MKHRLLTVFPIVLPFLLFAPSTSFADAASDAAACDALAASPKDFQKPGEVPGVAFDDVKGDEAIAACTISLQSNPDHPRILFELGRAYDAAKKQPEKQYEFYKKAADMGYVVSVYNFARLQEREGPHKDQLAANKLHCKAAQAGLQLAYVPCGYAHDAGEGFVQDYKVAMQWYKKAADTGDVTAITNLGIMYEQGSGVDKDMARAAEYHKKSADLGDVIGMNNYGNFLVQGIAVRQDIARGMDYLTKATEAGGEDAPVTLAETYDRGKEIPFDATKAASNYLVGLKRNGEQAKEALIDKAGAGIKPATLDAIQAQLKAEGKVFEARAGTLSPTVIAVLKEYPVK